MAKLNSFFGFFRKFNKLHLLGYSMVAVFFFGLVAYGYNSIFVQAAGNVTCYWVGDTSPAAWSDVTHWSSSSGGAGSTCDGGIIPSSTDIATFTSINTNSANVNVAVNVKGIAINTGYTGTISQDAGQTVAIGVTGFVQASGTYSATEIMTIAGGPFTKTGGTFSEGTGTITFSGSSATLTGNGQTFNHFTVSKTAGQILTIANGTTITVNGALTLTSGSIITSNGGTGTINGKGTVSQAATFTGGNAYLVLNGPGAQTYTINGGAALQVTFNNANLNVTPLSDCVFYGLVLTAGIYNSSTFTTSIVYFFTVNGGTFNADTGTVDFVNPFAYDTVINANGQNFNNMTINKQTNYKVIITAGTSITVNGILTLTNGTLTTGTINAKGTVVQNATFDGGAGTINLNAAGAQTYTISGGIAAYTTFNNANLNVTPLADCSFVNLTLTAGTLNGSNLNITFLGTATFTINGGTFNPGIGTVICGVSTSGVTSIDADGQQFNNVTVLSGINSTTGKSITVNGTLDLISGGFAYGTIYAKGTVIQEVAWTQNVNYQGTLMLNGTGAQTYTINGGYAPNVVLSNPDLTTTATGACSFKSLSMDNSVFNGTTYITSIGSLVLNTGAVFTATTGTLTIVNNFTINGGVFNANTGTVKFVGTVTSDATITADTQVFYKLEMNIVNNQGLVIPAGTSITVNNTLTLAVGKFPSGTIYAKGDVIFNAGGGGAGTVELNGTGAQSWTNALNAALPKVILNNAALNITPNANFSYNCLTITAGTFNASSYTITNPVYNGVFTVNGGTFNADTSTFIFSEVCPHTITADGATFNNLSFINHGGLAITITAGTTISVAGLLTLGIGLDVGGSVNTGTINVLGSISIVSRFYGGNANYNFAGTSLQTLSGTYGFGTSFTSGQVTVNSGAMVATSANTTITKLTIAAGGSFSAEDFTFTSTTLVNNGTFKLSGDKAVTTPTHGAGSTVEYIATAGTRNIQSWSYKGLEINGTGGTFTLPGTITAAEGVTITNGIFDLGANTLNVGGSWTKSGGTFTANTSTVNMNTATAATVTGDSTFYNLTLDGTAAGAKQINFTAGSTQTVGNTFSLTGAVAKVLTLRSTAPGAPWYFVIPGNMTSGTYINVQDSQNITNANRITAGANVTDAGNNDPGWLLSPATPTIGAPVALSATSIRWNFTDNATIEDGFKVYDAGNNLVATCATPNLDHCDETGLSVNTQYSGRYVVAYSNAYGPSAHSGTAVATYAYADNPLAPSLALSGFSVDKLITTINADTNPVNTTYAIYNETLTKYVQADGSLGASPIWQTKAIWNGVSGMENSGLTANTNYIYRIRVQNGDNLESTAPAEQFGPTNAKYTNIETPTSVVSVGTTPSSIDVTANGTYTNLNLGSAGLYLTETSGNPGGNTEACFSDWQQVNTDCLDLNLSAGIQYTYNVKARNTEGVETPTATTNISTSGAAGNNITGSLFDAIGGAKIAGAKSVKVSVNHGTPNIFTTTAGGDFTVTTSYALSGNDDVIIYVDGNAINASGVTKVNGLGDIAGFNIYQDYVTIRNDNGMALIGNTDLANAYVNDNDIDYTVTDNNVTFSNAIGGFYVESLMTYTPVGMVTSHNGYIAGTLNGGAANIISLSGSWTTTGTFNGDTSEVIFTSTAAETITSGSGSFTNIKFNGNGSFAAQNGLTASGAMTLTRGAFDANDQAISVHDFVGTGGIGRALSMGNGTWTISGDWNSTGNNQTINPEGSTADFTESSEIRTNAPESAPYDFYNLNLSHDNKTITLFTSVAVANEATLYNGTLNRDAGTPIETGLILRKSDGDPMPWVASAAINSAILYEPTASIAVKGHSFIGLVYYRPIDAADITITLTSSITGTATLIVYNRTVANNSTLEVGANNLTVASIKIGSSTYPTAHGMVNLGSGTHNISGNLGRIGSNTAENNALDLNTSNTFVAGNIDFTGVVLTPGTSNLTMNGTVAQNITAGGTGAGHKLYNLTIFNTSGISNGVTFNDSLELNAGATFADNTANSKLIFADGATFTFPEIDIDGINNGNIIITTVSGAETNWNITSASPVVSFVTVDHNNASAGSIIDATNNSTNAGLNTHWNFGGTGGTPQIIPTPESTPEPTPAPEKTNTIPTQTSTSQTPSNQITLKASNVTETQIVLSWEVTNVKNINGYKLYDGVTDQLIGETTSASYTLPNLKPNTNYSFYVVAVDSAGNSSLTSKTINVKTVAITTDQKVQTWSSRLVNYLKTHLLWFLTFTLILLFVLFFIILWKRRKKDDKQKKPSIDNENNTY